MAAFIVILSLAVVYGQVADLGFRFINVQQIKFHQKMLDGVAGNPWQYRIFADLLFVPFRSIFWRLGLSNPDAAAFVSFRFLQALLILACGAIYYRKLGINPFLNLIGLSILAWGMSNSLYDSELSFNTFFDIAFFLIGAILILDQNFALIIPLTAIAALNRETSVLVPVMLASSAIFGRRDPDDRKGPLISAGIALITFLVIFVALRLHYGEQPFITAGGNQPGLETLSFNVFRWVTWGQIFLTFGIIPILAVLSYGYYPQYLKILFWTIVPVWFVVHSFVGILAETRILLVPQAVVFIPAVCLAAQRVVISDM